MRAFTIFLLTVLTACGDKTPDATATVTKSAKSPDTPSPPSIQNSMCPDDRKVDLANCRFETALAPLKSKKPAVERFKATGCGEYDQTTINFCIGPLTKAAEVELDEAFEKAQSKAKAFDEEQATDCKAGTDSCTARPTLPPLIDAQKSWSKYVESHCDYKTLPMSQGTGYPSFGAFCFINHAAVRIDELNQEF